MKQILFITAALVVGALGPQNVWAQNTHDTHEHSESDKNSATYTCPMHPEVKSATPGSCPICGMALQKIEKQKGNTQGNQKKIKFYRHPMNPDVTSKVPAKDAMGMDYVPVYEEEEGAKGLSNVPQRGAFRIDATSFKLSGVVLVSVKKQDLIVTIPVSGRALSGSRLSVQVPEADISLLKPGLEVDATSPSVKEGNLLGKIVSMDSSLDPMTRTLRVDVQLTKSYPGLKSESSVQGFVKKKIPQTLTIPESAVMLGQGGTYIFLSDQESRYFIPRLVKTGSKAEGLVEVLDGVKEGDFISSGPNFLLDSESRIQASHGQ